MEGGAAPGLARWHAVRIMAGRERFVARQLERAGVMIYLPLIDRVIVVKNARRLYKRVMQWPMIPGYIFVYSLGLEDWHTVTGIPGVQNVMIEEAQPFVVPDSFIQTMLGVEIGDAVARLDRADYQIKALLPPEPKKQPGRRGKRGWRKRQRK
jgi:transcription antitermination factor NusG